MPRLLSWRTTRSRGSQASSLEERRRAVGRAVVDDQHLEIGVGLRQAALDGLTDERLAVPGGDCERDSRTRGLHAPCIGNVLLPLENGARTRLES